MYSRHEEYAAFVDAPAERVFEHLDDQTRLSAHMKERSWRMGWGKMNLTLDALEGRAVGSHIILDGRVLGVRLFLDEVVTERMPPLRKTWATVGQPRLVVIGSYSMTFELRRTDQQRDFESLSTTICRDVDSRSCWASCSGDRMRNGARRKWRRTRKEF